LWVDRSPASPTIHPFVASANSTWVAALTSGVDAIVQDAPASVVWSRTRVPSARSARAQPMALDGHVSETTRTDAGNFTGEADSCATDVAVVGGVAVAVAAVVVGVGEAGWVAVVGAVVAAGAVEPGVVEADAAVVAVVVLGAAVVAAEVTSGADVLVSLADEPEHADATSVSAPRAAISRNVRWSKRDVFFTAAPSSARSPGQWGLSRRQPPAGRHGRAQLRGEVRARSSAASCCARRFEMMSRRQPAPVSSRYTTNEGRFRHTTMRARPPRN
jgi:hypothetical protein